MRLIITETQFKAIEKIVRYLARDEEKDFEEFILNDMDTSDHIWNHISVLQDFVGLKTGDF